ncbi:hypothetical protein [Halorussus sp. MSC15.2]|uniref:hypothetical protein n=1 Tax=Halorussus sp. MSC15.2 TaxID=2283638 RepID=UPI0013D6254A|nr:hypothetical protein [Halorussus sp. MSC15.2]NEU58939.1 hypothetical protein [Halorussus sp. MSC15.2]
MADGESPLSQSDIESRIQQVGRYSRLVKTGFAVILLAFALAVVTVLPANLGSVAAAVDAILLPLIFVGMGLLLFGIGMHLHLLHLNLVHQLRKQNGKESQAAGRETESES